MLLAFCSPPQPTPLSTQVGGIKEKLLAARAAGLQRALVPARNMREVLLQAQEATRGGDDNDDDGGDALDACDGSSSSTAATAGSSSGLQVIPVARLEDVLAAAFDPPYLLRSRSKL